MGPNTNTPNYNQAPGNTGTNFEVPGNQSPQYNVDPSTTLNSGVAYNRAPLNGAEQLRNAERLAQPSQAMPMAATAAVTSTPAATTPQPVSQPVAKPQDAEQLEKVWVDKSKQVIASTREDPYEQAHQIALLMKGYLQARYGRTINNAGSK